MKRFLPGFLLLLILSAAPGAALAQTGTLPPRPDSAQSHQSLAALAKDWETAFTAIDTSLPPLRIRKPGQAAAQDAGILVISNIYAIKAVGSLLLIKYKDSAKQNWSVVISADQVLGFYH